MTVSCCRDIRCTCGNWARYISEKGELTCGICPLGRGEDSIRISDVPRLLALIRELEDFELDSTALRAAVAPIVGRRPQA